MRWLSLWVQNKRGQSRDEIQERVERAVNMDLDDLDTSRHSDDHADPEEDTIVDGLVLEDCGELGLIERWCVVTRDEFHICSRKDAEPSYKIPFAMVESAKAALSDAPAEHWSKLISGMNTSTLMGDLASQERQRAPGSPGLSRTGARMSGGPFSELHFPLSRPSQDAEKEDAGALDLDKGGFAITTKGSRFRKGEVHSFLTPNADTRDWWLHGIKVARDFQAGQPALSPWGQLRKSIYMWYQSDPFQITVAICIFLNFISQAAEAQIQPAPGSDGADVFTYIELIFLIIFCFELAVNMFATLFWPFFSSGWNWFDMVVIGTSIWSTLGDSGGGTGVLRLLRAGRVIRFFTRLPSLRKIIVALYESIPAMLNAMLLTGMVIAMYGVMGVSFFSADDRFKTFEVAIFTLFQASTGDGWSDIVLTLYTDVGSSYANVGISFYFISFMLIVALILMQVVIAVLLEEFSKVSDAESKSQENEDVACHFSLRPNPFEAFFEELHICRDQDSQIYKIVQIWQSICTSQNVSEVGKMGFSDMAAGLKLLKVRPPALLTPTDWNDMAVDTEICDSNYMIDKQGFVQMVQASLRAHIVRELTKCMYVKAWEETSIKAVLLAMRTLLQLPSVADLLPEPAGTPPPSARRSAPDSDVQNIQQDTLNEVKSISARMSKLESAMELVKLAQQKMNDSSKSAEQGARTTSPPPSHRDAAALGATLSKELPLSSHSSPVESSHSNGGGLAKLLQMEMKKKEEEWKTQSESILQRASDSEERLQQKEEEAANSSKVAEDLRHELALKEATVASAQALHREEIDAMRREIEAMKLSQKQQQGQQIKLPIPTLDGGKSPRGMPAALVTVSSAPLNKSGVHHQPKPDPLFSDLTDGTRSRMSQPRASSRNTSTHQGLQPGMSVTGQSRVPSEGPISQLRESQEVHDKLRELLDLKREINAFDRTREPAAGPRLLKSPVTSMTSRGSTGLLDDVEPRRSSDSSSRLVSITSPMQPPPQMLGPSAGGCLSMPPSPPDRSSPNATTISSDPNIHSSFLRILGMKASDGRISPTSNPRSD